MGLKQSKLNLPNLTLNTQNDIRSISKRVVGANETKSLSDSEEVILQLCPDLQVTILQVIHWEVRLLQVITVETLIRTAALIHFSRNFGQYLLSKMRLLFKLRLLSEGGSY